MYLLISIIVLLTSFSLFSRYGASLNPLRLNIYSYIFWLYLVLQSFVAAILTIYNIDDHYVIGKAGEHARYLGWLSVLWTMLMLPLGIGLGSLFMGIGKGNRFFESYCEKPMQSLLTEKDTLLKIVLRVFLFVSILSTIYTYRIIGTVPLIEAIRSPGSAALAMLRIDASREFSGNVFVRNIGSIMLGQILAYVCYGYYKLAKTINNRIIFYLSLINAVLAITYNIARSPLFFFFIGFLFIRVLIDGNIGKKIFVSAVIIIVAGVVGATVLTTGNDDLRNLLLSYNVGIPGRIFLSQAAGTYVSFEIFPRVIEHLGIRSMSTWLPPILGMDYSERSARLVMEYVNPHGVETGTAGVMNSLFIGEAWANFGLFGFIFSPLIVGSVIGIVFTAFLKLPKSPLYIGALGYLSFRLSANVTGGFNDFVYPNILFIIIFLVFFMRYLVSFFQASVRKKYSKIIE